MTRKPMPYGEEFQKGVLKLMCQDDAFCSKAVSYLHKDYFKGELKWFFDTIEDTKQQFKRPPSHSDIQTEIYKHDPSDQAKYQKILKEIFDTNPSFDKTKRELTGFIRANLFVTAYHKAQPLFNQGNHEDAYQVTFKQLDQLLKVDFEREKVVRFGDHEAIMLEASHQSKDAIPTGIHAIDEAMGGGLHPQTWTTFLGGSNVGKSMLSASLAYFAAMKGKKTFVTIHEDEELPSKLRFLSRFSGIPYTRLTYGKAFLSDEEKIKIAKADKVLSQFVVLRFMYLEEATIEKVTEAARMLMKEWPYHLFICDYGQCLTTSRFKSLDQVRLVQEYIYQQLKQLCLDLNIAGAGGAQANRSGHAMNKSGSDWLRSTDVAEAFGIVRKSSNFITMNRSEVDVLNNKLVFLLDKVRNGRCPVAVECDTNFGACTTHMPHIDPSGNHTQREISVTEGPAVQKAQEDAV